MGNPLTERERLVLDLIIRTFILTANPVGSRYLAKRCELNLSDATIRNVMADLEHDGYITQPHTSAGRIPTDKGYRLYVDSMIKVGEPLKSERTSIDKKFDPLTSNLLDESTLQESSRILGKISQQIGLTLTPKLSKGTFQRLDLVQLSSERLLIIISITDGFLKTVVIELASKVSLKEIEKLASRLNESLTGLSLEEIRDTFANRVADFDGDKSLVRVFIDSSDKIFEDTPQDRVFVSGKENIFSNPEFDNVEKLKGIIELVENKNIILHLIENSSRHNTLTVTPDSLHNPIVKVFIGKENQDSKMKDCSLITAKYFVGKSEGLIGVIGPTRMNYEKMTRIISYMAKRLTEKFS